MLKSCRAEKNLTQKQIAQKLGVVESCYANWEQGRTEPGIDSLIALSKIFMCSVDYLIGNETEDGKVIITSDDELRSDEREFLQIYNELPRDYKFQARGMMKLLKEESFKK